jgi:hypothetical protein
VDRDAAISNPETTRRDAAKAADTPLVRWVHAHDESWLFIISYVGLAVVLSIWISIFWLVVVVCIHFGLELVRQGARSDGPRTTLGLALWETKLDFSLVLFALALGVYMEWVLGLAGLGPAARLGAQSAARAAGWTRALRGVLLSVDDAAQVCRAFAGRGVDTEAKPALARRWSVGDHIGIWLGVLCTALIVLAPALTDHTALTVVQTVLQELHPWPQGR